MRWASSGALEHLQFMALSARGRIRQEQQSYRRGFLVGVTLAEICILLVFVLLLLSVSERWRRGQMDKRLKELGGQEALNQEDPAEVVLETELTRLRERDEIARRIEEVSGLDLDREEDFDRLVRDIRSTAEDRARLRAGLQNVLRDVEGMDADAVARRIESLATQVASLEAQKQEMLGRGLVYPSCMHDERGGTTFAYDLILADAGISGVATTDLRAFASTKGIVLRGLGSNEVLGPDEFAAHTRPLFDWSYGHDCRFFVRVMDATDENSKIRYKQLLDAVEKNFYKLLVGEGRPAS